MRRLLVKARTRVGVAVIGAAVLAGAGSATAAVLVQPASSTSEDGAVFEAPAAETTAPGTVEPTPEPEVSPVDEPAAETDTATVDTMPQPETTPAPAPPASPTAAMRVPSGVTPIDPADPARGGHDAEGSYVPAAPVQAPGGPPVGPDWGTSGTTADPGPEGIDLG